MLKQTLRDPSFWLLIAFNGYCIHFYIEHPERFNDIVWLYWGQSVLIGFFNFIDLLTIRHVLPGSMKIGEKPIEKAGTGCAATFFLFHYQFFHIGYFVFLLTLIGGFVNREFILLGLAVISIELLVGFIRQKIRQRTELTNVGKLFFLPYLRIIPMHLMILLPSFFNLQASITFLILKMIADLIMYLLTSRLKLVSNVPA